MRALVPLLALVVLAGCAASAHSDVRAAADHVWTEGMPADVQSFIVQYANCEHFIGEEAYDARRARFLTQAIARDCTGIDARARELRIRYRSNPVVSERLATFEAIGQ